MVIVVSEGGNPFAVALNVSKISSMPFLVSWCAVLVVERVEVRASGETSVCQVT